MKQFYILLIALLASAVAMGQHSIPSLSLSGVYSSPITSGERLWYEINPGKTLKPQSYRSQDLIQLFDSIIGWALDTTTSGWIPRFKTKEYVYDPNHNLTGVLTQIWDTSHWVNLRQSNSTYDVNNNQISWVSQTWNGSVWVNTEQILSTYDAGNNLTV